jgi:NAD(P)-dependent dehydrogenase (short-subunit alcohol dehydrogenase family)
VLLFNASKQATNPGANFGAYGLPKAATLFLSRQYALEHGKPTASASNAVNADRIRSGLLNDEMIESRSPARGLCPSRTTWAGNLLGLEVTADDVAQAPSCIRRSPSGRQPSVTTVDGGNIAAALR